MTLAFSLYLDLVRFLLALGVFIYHLALNPDTNAFTTGLLWEPLGIFGRFLVPAFFVLSGYVIAYVVASREQTARFYAASRISRLYSVVLAALPLTYLLDRAGMAINPELYALPKVLIKPESLAGYLSSLFFVNEFQVFRFNGIVPGTNSPYWSLSFEACYYVIAGLLLFMPRRFAIPAVILLLLLAGNTIAALLPVWALGYVLFRQQQRFAWRKEWAVALFFMSLALYLAMPFYADWLVPDNFGLYFPWGRQQLNRRLLSDYTVAFWFGFNLLAAQQWLKETSVLERFAPFIRRLGALTFPLYCLHVPALYFFRSMSPWPRDSWANLLFISLGVLLLVAAVTPLCERLKKMLRKKL